MTNKWTNKCVKTFVFSLCQKVVVDCWSSEIKVFILAPLLIIINAGYCLMKSMTVRTRINVACQFYRATNPRRYSTIDNSCFDQISELATIFSLEFHIKLGRGNCNWNRIKKKEIVCSKKNLMTCKSIDDTKNVYLIEVGKSKKNLRPEKMNPLIISWHIIVDFFTIEN